MSTTACYSALQLRTAFHTVSFVHCLLRSVRERLCISRRCRVCYRYEGIHVLYPYHTYIYFSVELFAFVESPTSDLPLQLHEHLRLRPYTTSMINPISWNEDEIEPGSVLSFSLFEGSIMCLQSFMGI
jgi:hypothetical protein